MTIDRLEQRPITPMKQSTEASCVPTSISMVFSGFGIDISEQTLVDKYFPTVVGLPISARDPDKGVEVGVSNEDTVKGIVQIIGDFGLRGQLQVDVFMPGLYEYTKSSEQKYIVQAEPRALREYRNRFKKGDRYWEFYETLEQLLESGEIGVYTPNSRMMKIPKFGSFSMVPREAVNGFYDELSDFIAKGHIVGPHSGMTLHTRALDGSRRERLTYRPGEEGYVVVDPRGESYAISLSSLVCVDSMGVRGDVFDYLFRVSPRENELKAQTYGFRRFLQNLRDLTP